MKEKLKDLWQNNHSLLTFCLAVVFIFGLLGHGYQFANFNLCHDSFDGLYLTGRENDHKTELGRFFSPIYRSIFRGSFTAPWVVGIFTFLWIGLALFFVVKTFDMKSKVLMALTGGIMTVNLAVTATAATFMHDLDVNMFALMLACLAAFVWRKAKLPWLAVGALCICASCGIYQSYISVTITMIMFALLIDFLENRKLTEIVYRGITGMAMGGAGSVLYLVFIKLSDRLFNVPLSSRSNSISTLLKLDPDDIPKLIKKAYTTWWEYFASFFTNWQNADFMLVVNVIIMAAALVTVALFIFKNKTKPLYIIPVIAIIALSPLAMNIACVISFKIYHDLMKYTFVFMYIFALVMMD